MYINIDMLYKIVSIVVVVAVAAAICCFRCHNEWNKVESGDIAGESYSPKSYLVLFVILVCFGIAGVCVFM